MPNIPIVDLSISCPSNCSLLGTSSIMRNFLLGKNLPSVPTDIIEAGLISEWYNDGNVAPAYEVFDPTTLTNPGDVLADINAWRTKHANINLYDDYSDEHYNPSQFTNYTQYPLLSINDSIAAVKLHGFGTIEAWTDMDAALAQDATWETKWTLELANNRYSPSSTYSQIPALPSHSDNIFSDITGTIMDQFLNTQYNISGFITTDNRVYTPLTYNQNFLEAHNKYKQTAENSYLSVYFGTPYYNFADPELSSPSLTINNTNDTIDQFTNEIVAFPTPTPQGVRDWYNTTYNHYSLTSVYKSSEIGFYANGNIDFMPGGDSSDGFLPNNDLLTSHLIVNSIDNFILDVPDFSSLGFTNGEPLTPTEIRGNYCAYENIYGGTSEITENVDRLPSDSPIYQYNTTPKVLNCYSYVTSVVDPFTYGIQDSREVSSNLLNPENLLQEYLPPQATINVGVDSPMDLNRYGVTSTIQAALGFVLPNMPVPLDAVLNQIDKNAKDTPLGKTARVKLASEVFNRIALNLRQEAYGMTEKIGQGLITLAGNLISPVVGSDKQPNGLTTMVETFKNHEITVPKTIIGKAANLISSFAGINLKLDPIQEPIAWTSYIPKTETESSNFNEEPTADKRSFWSRLGLGSPTKTNDPSEILLAYTSSGQRQFLSNTLKLNTYFPNYQIVGFRDEGAEISKKQRKLLNLQTRLQNNQARKKDYEGRQDELENEITQLTKKLNSNSNNLLSIKLSVKEIDKRRIYAKLIAIDQDIKTTQQAIEQLNYTFPNGWYPTEDDGTFNGTLLNSQIKSLTVLLDTHPDMDIGGIKAEQSPKDFAQSTLNNGSPIYEYPVDDRNNISRYRKNRTAGMSPESDELHNSTVYNLYQAVSDLVKHGVKPDNTGQQDLRGLNINSLDKPHIGYNVYPYLPQSADNILHHPGLGREDIYQGQSLFSVLESNGFVKISPLWGGDGYGGQIESVQKNINTSKRYKIENAGSDAIETYKERVKIHRYMFSLENLAWKGFDLQLPWWERGPNGGRIMWFPPYDLRISDTTSVSLGQENLIGRNEPIYTYNHSERSGVLSFKMIMDFPGYHSPDTKYEEPQTETIIPQQIEQDITDSITVQLLNAPQVTENEWDITSDTYMYIFLDTSESMQAYSQTVKNLFVGDSALFKKKLIDAKIYTEDTYKNQVFVFYDPGKLAMGDNLDDGRIFSWFAAPHFMAQGIDTHYNTITYTNPQFGSHTGIAVPSMVTRLKDINNIQSGNIDQLNAITGTPTNVICIAAVNEVTPAYLQCNPSNGGTVNYKDDLGTLHHTTLPEGSGVCRLYSDISDFVTAKAHYSDKFKGIILGYDANLSQDVRDKTSNDMFAIFCKNLFGNGNDINVTTITEFNNIDMQNPTGVQWAHNNYNFSWSGEATTYHGDFASTTVQSIPQHFDEFSYILEIGANGGINGTTDGGEEVADNIIAVITKMLVADPANVEPNIQTTEYTHEHIPKLRGYMRKMAKTHPEYNSVMNGDHFVWDDGIFTELTVDQVKQIAGPSEESKENTYDIELWKLLTKNTNAANAEINPNEFYINVRRDSGILSVFAWMREISNGGFDDKGNFTADGWRAILKYIGFEPTNQSIPTNDISTEQPKNLIAEDLIKWGIDIDNMVPENQLNEFLYFKRLEQTDKIYNDIFKDKIKFFDPAFHSITPVGFNNRLNFLEQCARQGPSINNAQGVDGQILNANSNLAFGRPPISVLRIGDFYYTRIAIEGVDLSYEPLIFDLNPEGIGVQPMIVDVTINFKYLGGSSLSGPITELQNAVSNNYFANVEFYHTQALKAFDRIKTQLPETETTNQEIYIDNNNMGELAFTEPTPTTPDQQGTAQQANNQQSQTGGAKANNSKSRDKVRGRGTVQPPGKCACPPGYTIVESGWQTNKWLCITNANFFTFSQFSSQYMANRPSVVGYPTCNQDLLPAIKAQGRKNYNQLHVAITPYQSIARDLTYEQKCSTC